MASLCHSVCWYVLIVTVGSQGQGKIGCAISARFGLFVIFCVRSIRWLSILHGIAAAAAAVLWDAWL
jgi:hypothetical protein